MKNAFFCCCEHENSNQDMRRYMMVFRPVVQTMFSEMRRAPRTERIPYDFIREMIPHHQGAVSMSENALRFPVCPQLIPILDAIIIPRKKAYARCRNCSISHPLPLTGITSADLLPYLLRTVPRKPKGSGLLSQTSAGTVHIFSQKIHILFQHRKSVKR